MLLVDNAEAIIPVLFFVLAGGVALIATAFWIWLLVDAIQNETDENERLLWILLIVLLPFIGSILYLFMRKLGRRK